MVDLYRCSFEEHGMRLVVSSGDTNFFTRFLANIANVATEG